MPSPRCSRRQFLAATGTTAVPLVGVSGDRVAARPSPPDSTWLRRYDAVQPGTLVDVEPAHGGGWVLAGSNFERSSGVLLGVAADGRVEWDRRLATERDGRLVAVTATPEGYAVVGQTDEAQGWLAFLPATEGQPGTPRLDQSTDAVGSTASVRPRLRRHPEGGVVLATGTVSSHHATTRVRAFDTTGAVRWRQVYEREHILGFLVPYDDGWLLGGSHRASGPAWLAALGPAGERRWETTVGDSMDFDAHDAVPAGEGVTLAVSYNDTVGVNGGLVHVGPGRSVRWHSRHEGVEPQALARTTNGGYAFAGSAAGGGVGLVRMGEEGSIQWTATADEDREGTDEVFDLVERAPNAFLLVGTHEIDFDTPESGWAMGLTADSEADGTTPPSSPTNTPAPSTSRDSPTSTSASDSPNDTPTAPAPAATGIPTTSRPAATNTSTPGFSTVAAAGTVGIVALLGALRRNT